MLPVPANIALLVNQPDYSQMTAEFLKSDLTDEQRINLLARHFSVQVWFREPTQLWVRRRMMTVTNHTFRGFFFCGDRLCYKDRSTDRTGHYFEFMDRVVKYEPVIECDRFDTYEQFKRKFDPRFITELEIKKLWVGKSAQHGGKYKPSDFRKLSRTGLALMARFLQRFTGIGTQGGPVYMDRDGYKILTEYYTSNARPNSQFGRDISISHQTNLDWVSYASEYPGCGNGRYGLVANAREYLWLEDD